MAAQRDEGGCLARRPHVRAPVDRPERGECARGRRSPVDRGRRVDADHRSEPSSEVLDDPVASPATAATTSMRVVSGSSRTQRRHRRQRRSRRRSRIARRHPAARALEPRGPDDHDVVAGGGARAHAEAGPASACRKKSTSTSTPPSGSVREASGVKSREMVGAVRADDAVLAGADRRAARRARRWWDRGGRGGCGLPARPRRSRRSRVR